MDVYPINDSEKVFASQSESCIVYIQIGFQILAAFLSAPPSNFPAKAEESSRFVVAAQTCLYGIRKTRTHQANHSEMSHCSKKI